MEGLSGVGCRWRWFDWWENEDEEGDNEVEDKDEDEEDESVEDHNSKV